MKKLIFIFIVLIPYIRAGATELDVDGIIVNFPCLIKSPVKSGDTETYSCTSKANITCQLQIIKKANIVNDDAGQEMVNKDINQTCEEFIAKYIEGLKGTLIMKEERTLNGKKIRSFSFAYTEGGTPYLSESLLYVRDDKILHVNTFKKNDNIKVADTEIFLNSLILLK